MMRMNNQEKKSKENFQQRPSWIFITIIIILIQASSSFSDLILDFFPTWINYEGWIKLFFIIAVSLFLGRIYWKEQKQNYFSDKISDYDKMMSEWNEAKRQVLIENIFKHYPLNVITLKIIPLSICWFIRQFINKRYKPYGLNYFNFPKDWKGYDYEEFIREFFENMLRIYIREIDRSYEIKFARDFRYLEIRWTDKDERFFNEPKRILYEEMLSMNDLKHISIFTWIVPFGLYWNLRRAMKKISKSHSK